MQYLHNIPNVTIASNDFLPLIHRIGGPMGGSIRYEKKFPFSYDLLHFILVNEQYVKSDIQKQALFF